MRENFSNCVNQKITIIKTNAGIKIIPDKILSYFRELLYGEVTHTHIYIMCAKPRILMKA